MCLLKYTCTQRRRDMDKKVIYINSQEQYRDIGGSDEDFTITKDVQEFPVEPKSVKLIHATIPFTWNNVTANNNTFSVTENGPVPVTDAFVIPIGNYTGDQLAEEVQDLLNNSGTLTQTYSVTFDSQTLKYTFTTSPNGMQITFAASGSAALLLGFAEDSTTPGTASTSFDSTNTAQLLPDYEIFICSDLVRGSDNGVIPWKTGSLPGALAQNQILARIPLTGCYSGLIHYSAHTDLPYYICTQSKFSKVRSSADTANPSIRFFLAFPSGETVDLNGYHWTAERVLNFNE